MLEEHGWACSLFLPRIGKVFSRRISVRAFRAVFWTTRWLLVCRPTEYILAGPKATSHLSEALAWPSSDLGHFLRPPTYSAWI